MTNATGGTPEMPDRWEPSRERYNRDATGEKVQALDQRDAAPPPTSNQALATKGDAALPSDVTLQDRRRPYGLYAGTMLLSRRA